MKYLAAYALLALSGKKDITAQDLKTLLSSVQSHASDDDINKIISALKGKPLHQLIAEGQLRIGSSGSAPSGGAPKAAEKKEVAKKQQPKKKEEPKKKEQPKVEQDQDLGGLFD